MRLADSTRPVSQRPGLFGRASADRSAESDEAAFDGCCARGAAPLQERAHVGPERAFDTRTGAAVEAGRRARAAREASAALPNGAGSAEARPRKSLDSSTMPRAGCLASALRSTSSEPRQSVVPARPAFDGMRAIGASTAACRLPAAFTRVRRLPFPSTAVAIEACQRPPSARPVSDGASISRLRTHRPPAMLVASNGCRGGAA